MHKPIENGILFTFADIDCWTPPIPKKADILFSNLPKKDQKWKREPLPDFYKELRPEERRIQQEEWELVQKGELDKIYHFNPILEKYRRKQWDMRMKGVHIMINGQVIYLTGAWWFYLQWCKFDHKENGGYPIFYMSQRKRFYFRQSCTEDDNCLGYLIIGSRGFGKCFLAGTEVRMYEGGLKSVEEICVGDLLMGPDSEPREVLSLHDGHDDMFEIEQNQADNYVCNSEHVISLRRNAGKTFTIKNGKRRYPQYDQVANIPLVDLVGKSATFFSSFSGYKVGVEYKEKPISLDPYFLGIWLGDGNTDYPIIHTMDQEVVDFCYDYAERLKMDIYRLKTGTKADRFTFTSKGARSSPNPLLNLMREQGLVGKKYGLIGNKFIPFNYLYNTRDIRLKLLAGLLDSDGYQFSGVYEFVQKKKSLAEDTKLLADTLGFKTSMKEKVVNGVSYWRVFISGHNGEIPVKIERKKCSPSPNKDHRLTKIKAINYIGRDKYYGFGVDKDHLFLLKDGTVVHNSTEETATIIESMTRGPKRRRAVIQSKSKDDARDVIFNGKFVPCFKSLPDFFQPNNNHGTKPETKLSFFLDAKRGAKANLKYDIGDYELENVIGFVPAKEKANDGDTLSEMFIDELGKTSPSTEADVYKRQNVHRFCVYRNDRKTGMIRNTTTVEEMNEGGDECKMVWDESNQKVINENGLTTSGLYRMFVGVLETSTKFADEYGVIDEDKARKWQEHERESRKHDSKALSSWIRKNPMFEEESFIKDASKSVFNVFALTTRLQELHSMKRMPYLRGNFYWVDKVDGIVDFKEDKHAGRFLVAKILDVRTKKGEEKPGQILANQMSFYKDTEGKKQWAPKNNRYFRIGTDPIKYSKTKDPRASKMAIHGFELYNPSEDSNREREDWRTHNFMFEYIHRPEDPETAYEDAIMAIRYYGCSIFPETNIKELAKHLHDRGYRECVIWRRDFDADFINGQQDDAGLASNQEVIHSYVTRLITFINRHGHRIKFPRTIEALLEFEPNNTTLYDAVVSAGYTLFAAEAPLDLEVELEDIGDWFDEYSTEGSRSTILDAF